MNNKISISNISDKDILGKTNKILNIGNKLTIKTLISSPINLNKELLKTFVGIDFGTSTTVVSIATCQADLENIQASSIELNQKIDDGTIYKSYKIPTMIGWYKNSLLVGEGVNKIKLKLKQGKNLWHSFKMELGKDVGSMYPESELNNDKIKISNPKDATNIFFKYLKMQIEKYVREHSLSSNIEYAVSIPASFEANQRKDLISSLHINNMMKNKQALIDEPNAAFLSYVSNTKENSEIYLSEDFPTNILVFDFGAGTCDISILEVAKKLKGYYSKNLSISRFEALGGNDIDKMIALDILLPQFLDANEIQESLFKSKEITAHILPRLEKAAELLKIKISEELSLIESLPSFEQIIDSDKSVQINFTIEIRSRKGIFKLEKPKLSYKDFKKINDIFTNTKKETDDKSVFLPIFSALDKAGLNHDDIDYLLFIGGSSKNPLIQKSLKKYFDKTEHLIPRNLQQLVSSGAAIHSLMFNGYDTNIIKPITSEAIIIIIQDRDMEISKVILKAGTTIPCEEIHINDLKPQKDGQIIIELPICIGTKDKILHNIKIESPSKQGFNSHSDINLIVSINADKMLIIKANIDGEKIDNIEPLNPFSNKITSFRDRQKFEAEKEYNLALSLNLGNVDKNSLLKLYNQYSELEFELDAAETLEELNEKFNYGSLNNIGLHYGNSGDKEKAMAYYEKAMEKAPSAVTALNIANRYRFTDRKLYTQWIKKSMDINPSYINAYYSYGVILVENDDEEKGYKLINKAFDSWKTEYENDALSSDISWFISCARFLNKYDYAKELESAIDNIKDNDEESYNINNLTTLKNNNKLKEI